MRFRPLRGVATVVLAILFGPHPSRAQELDPTQPEVLPEVRGGIPKGWRIELQPYAFIPLEVNGDATVRSRDIPFSADLSDLTKNFKLGGQLRFEAWRGRWGLILDESFLKLGETKTLLGTPIDLVTRVSVSDALIGVRPFWWPLGEEAALSIELHAGVRLAWLSESVTIGGDSLDADRVYARCIVGVRVPLRLSRAWVLGAEGAISIPGPGLTSMGWGEWDPSKLIALRLGYRVDRLDYSGDRAGLGVWAHGPYIGLGLRFGTGSVF